jgi:hypothetical protein
MGNPNQPTGDGYKVVDAVPRDTQRQVISDREYYGGAQTQGPDAPRSYEDVYNATIDSLKEETLVNRDPTQTSVKVAAGEDELGALNIRRQELTIDLNEIGQSADRVVNIPVDSRSINLTKQPQEYDDINDDVIDTDILQAFKDNPFTQSLNSYA